MQHIKPITTLFFLTKNYFLPFYENKSLKYLNLNIDIVKKKYE